MDVAGFDNIYSVVLILLFFSAIYFYFIYSPSASSAARLKSSFPFAPSSYTEQYRPLYPGSKESFVAPATIMKRPEPVMVPRDVSPSGPSPPNARVENVVAKQNDIYNVVPNDPQDEKYSSQDIQDNLRYPERMFGPGVVNDGNKLLRSSEVANNKILDSVQPLQPFSPEMVSNGGLLDGIAANDTDSNPNYASF